ncbi:unnamed protein product [Choristocarpus tenellus]
MNLSEVQAAVSALYGHNPDESARANKFLMEFMEQPTAWALSIELLSIAGSPESIAPLQYFSANTLYTKVRKHWHQLDAERRGQLSSIILEVPKSIDTGRDIYSQTVWHSIVLVVILLVFPNYDL